MTCRRSRHVDYDSRHLARGIPARPARERDALPSPVRPNDIRCLCLDVDGVLTDGRIHTAADGQQTRVFHVHDGFAIRCFIEAGGVVVLCSGKNVPAVDARARELGIAHVLQGSRDKLADLRPLLARMGVTLAQLAMVGDDLPDVPVLRACGLPIAVANAVDEVKRAAALVTRSRGGEGAVREAIEYIMRASGAWDAVLRKYGVEA